MEDTIKLIKQDLELYRLMVHLGIGNNIIKGKIVALIDVLDYIKK